MSVEVDPEKYFIIEKRPVYILAFLVAISVGIYLFVNLTSWGKFGFITTYEVPFRCAGIASSVDGRGKSSDLFIEIRASVRRVIYGETDIIVVVHDPQISKNVHVRTNDKLTNKVLTIVPSWTDFILPFAHKLRGDQWENAIEAKEVVVWVPREPEDASPSRLLCNQ